MAYKGRAVKCIDTNEIFNSCNEAAKAYNMHPSFVSKVCAGVVDNAKGKRFEYLHKPVCKVQIVKDLNGNCKGVFCITHLNTFNSGKEAAKALGISANSISDVCSGKRRTTHGLRFCFVSEMDKYSEEIAVQGQIMRKVYEEQERKRKEQERIEKAKADYSKACEQYNKARESVKKAREELYMLGITEL